MSKKNKIKWNVIYYGPNEKYTTRIEVYKAIDKKLKHDLIIQHNPLPSDFIEL